MTRLLTKIEGLLGDSENLHEEIKQIYESHKETEDAQTNFQTNSVDSVREDFRAAQSAPQSSDFGKLELKKAVETILNDLEDIPSLSAVFVEDVLCAEDFHGER